MSENGSAKGDKKDRIGQMLQLVTTTLPDQIPITISKFAAIAEKGTAIFLLSAGATFICFGIALTWRSESLFDQEMEHLISEQSEHRSPYPEQGGSRPIDQARPSGGEFQTNPGIAQIPTGFAPTITLIVGGMILVLGGAATSLISYRWDLNAYSSAQAYNVENLRLQIQLRQAGLNAILKESEVDTPPQADRPHMR